MIFVKTSWPGLIIRNYFQIDNESKIMMDKYDEGQKKSLTPVVLAAARCCLSLSSMLSSSPALLGLASNSTSFEASFSTRPASTMASTSIRKRPRVRPSLKRPRWDKSEIFEKQNSFIVETCATLQACWPKLIGINIFSFTLTRLFQVSKSVSTSFSWNSCSACDSKLARCVLNAWNPNLLMMMLWQLCISSASSSGFTGSFWRLKNCLSFSTFPWATQCHFGLSQLSTLQVPIFFGGCFDLNPLCTIVQRLLDWYWHFRPSPILVYGWCHFKVYGWCHFKYKSEVTFYHALSSLSHQSLLIYQNHRLCGLHQTPAQSSS